jgi:Copper transport outer membrane protein, MctB
VVLDNWIAVVIDFRYHLVSIIAVFLALAVGLLVGVTALSGPAESLLQRELTVVRGNNNTLAKDKKDLTNQVNADQAFAQAAAPRLLGGLLTGQDVVLVTAPGSDSSVTNGVTTALKQAGATVTGQVNLNPSFLDTSAKTESNLAGLAGGAGISLPSQPSNPAVAGQQAAAAVIAAAVLGRDGSTSGVSAAVLSPFMQAGYLSLSGALGSAGATSPATLAVLVVPAVPPPSSVSTTDDEVLVAVAQELHAAGRGAVMAGGVSAIGPGSAISAEDSAGQVSTVDNADYETGQIMVVQALVNAAAGRPAKQYGVSSGAAPSPAPTPSPSPTVSTSPGRTSSRAKTTGAKK